MSLTPEDQDAIYVLAGLLAAIGAVNWGLREFVDYDILTDLLALSPGSTEYQIVVAAIAGGGLLALYASSFWNILN
jgi:uncharacterized membrane protein YuzA (DUF378 family)